MHDILQLCNKPFWQTLIMCEAIESEQDHKIYVKEERYIIDKKSFMIFNTNQ